MQSGYGQELLTMEQNKESLRILHVFTTRYNTQHHQPQEHRGPENAHLIPLPSAGSHCQAESISPTKSHGHAKVHEFFRIPSVKDLASRP